MVWPADLADRVVADSRIRSEVKTYIGELTGIILCPLTLNRGVDGEKNSFPGLSFFGLIYLASDWLDFCSGTLRTAIGHARGRALTSSESQY